MGGIINKFAPKGVEMMGSAAADLTNGFIGTVVMIISAYFLLQIESGLRKDSGELFQKT